ncbi:carboxylesterase [Bacillus fengqiuensis]|nr:carboxylesterase [Bacillus fengqiuensis]
MKENYPVIKGAEPFYFKGNDIGLLISHGFMGTPQSVRFLGESLSRYGYTVLGPRLKGHGTHYQDLEKCTHEEWLAELERGYPILKEQCSTIFVMGQSMGGTLALWLADKYPNIKGIILINAALSVPAFEYLKGKAGPKFISEKEPDLKARGIHEITYPNTPLRSIHELQKLMEKTPAIIPSITHPILCFKSAEDHVVPPENTEYIIEHIGSDKKEMVTLFNSYHVASMDNDKEIIVEYCHRFIERQVFGEQSNATEKLGREG